MTWNDLLKQGENRLCQAQIEEAPLDAWYLLEHVSGMNRAAFFLRRQEKVGKSQEEQEMVSGFLSLIGQRAQRIPLQYLTGNQEFMGLSFLVGPQVLVPRQDTEFLVEKLLPLVSGKRVLDMCTGSGCIAVSLAVLGKPEQVDACDLSGEALFLAEENARRNGADVHFFQSDLFEGISDRYDVIVSNPPYIESGVIDTLLPEVRDHEPRMALDGGEDGLLFYRRIADCVQRYLQPGGMVCVEIGCGQGESVTGLFSQAGLERIACYQDLCGRDRVVCAERNMRDSFDK